jgi:hypothetical protein
LNVEGPVVEVEFDEAQLAAGPFPAR